MKKWSVVIILALAQFVMVLDGTVMNVSISTIVKDLDTTVSSLQTAITFYTLTMAALMLIGAKLCARLGLLRAFMIGSVIYGIGSLLTGLSPNIQTLFLGWSIIEGLGAILVIPAIAALVAINYSGKDRITAYAIIGGISGAAAAAGPLIGGFMTTYTSWRYVFFAETAIMIVVLIMARKFRSAERDASQKIDIPSALLSASGMSLLVYGLLKAKDWGVLSPLATPVVGGVEIALFGISIVPYLIVAGIILLKLFYDRQVRLEATKNTSPLLNVSMLRIPALRAGLLVLSSQTAITAAAFFVAPVYLQLVLGLNALETGMKLLPLSFALILASIAGSRLSGRYSPKTIVRYGQYLLVAGAVALLAAIDPELSGPAFMVAMFCLGVGLGLLASQLGNVNMSAVDQTKTSEVGGLQGTFQNLGSSLGTAIVGSVLIASLTTGFVAHISNADLPNSIKTYVSEQSEKGIQVVAAHDVEAYAIAAGSSKSDAETIRNVYVNAQLNGLREAIFVIAVIAGVSLLFSRYIPDKIVGASSAQT